MITALRTKNLVLLERACTSSQNSSEGSIPLSFKTELPFPQVWMSKINGQRSQLRLTCQSYHGARLPAIVNDLSIGGPYNRSALLFKDLLSRISVAKYSPKRPHETPLETTPNPAATGAGRCPAHLAHTGASGLDLNPIIAPKRIIVRILMSCVPSQAGRGVSP